jgi:F-type H+-transporting ATPase subunit delta
MRSSGPAIEILHERYSRAIFDVARESDKLDDVFDKMNLLNELAKKNKNLLKILNNPEIDKKDKIKTLEIISRKADLPEELLSFLKILVKNNRIGLLHGIFLKYRDLYDKNKGRVKVFVETAVSLGKKEIARLEEILSRSLKKAATVVEILSPSVIGGIDIKIKGAVYKLSLADRLRFMKKRLQELAK